MRHMRWLLRWPFSRLCNGLCLLSLLVCLLTVWLLFRGDGRPDVLEAGGGGMFVRVESAERVLAIGLIRNWPGHFEVLLRSGDDGDWIRDQEGFPITDRGRAWSRLGLSGWHGNALVYLTLDGRPRRVYLAEARWMDVPHQFGPMVPGQVPPEDRVRQEMEAAGVRWSGPMPYWTVDDLPTGWVAGATAVPPLVWLILRFRRLYRLRRCRKLGLCGRCGYDLRATPSRCPECGWVADGDGRSRESMAS